MKFQISCILMFMCFSGGIAEDCESGSLRCTPDTCKGIERCFGGNWIEIQSCPVGTFCDSSNPPNLTCGDINTCSTDNYEVLCDGIVGEAPSPLDCHNFYVCLNNKIAEEECDAGDFYNSSIKSCQKGSCKTAPLTCPLGQMTEMVCYACTGNQIYLYPCIHIPTPAEGTSTEDPVPSDCGDPVNGPSCSQPGLVYPVLGHCHCYWLCGDDLTPGLERCADKFSFSATKFACEFRNCTD